MTPLERAARALAMVYICERDAFEPTDYHAVQYAEHAWKDHVEQARAVLTAIREPDEVMLPDPNHTDTALYRAARLLDDQSISSADTFSEVWTAMIDAILAGGE